MDSMDLFYFIHFFSHYLQVRAKLGLPVNFEFDDDNANINNGSSSNDNCGSEIEDVATTVSSFMSMWQMLQITKGKIHLFPKLYFYVYSRFHSTFIFVAIFDSVMLNPGRCFVFYPFIVNSEIDKRDSHPLCQHAQHWRRTCSPCG